MKNPISRLLSIGLLIIYFASCKSEPIIIDYCQMLKDDQSFVNQDMTDMAKFKADKAQRTKLIAKNFDLLIKKTKRDGFPRVNDPGIEADSCRQSAIQMTLIHTAQSNPKQFFSEDISTTFKKEIDKGNLDPELLRRASIVAAMTEEFCLAQKPDMFSALNNWGLDIKILADAKFVNCN